MSGEDEPVPIGADAFDGPAAFESLYWNLNMALAWIMVRDRAIVNEVAAAYDRHSRGGTRIALLAAYANKPLNMTDREAAHVLLLAARSGRVTINGLPKNEPPRQAIPLGSLGEARVDEGQPVGWTVLADAVRWHDCQVWRASILAIWPADGLSPAPGPPEPPTPPYEPDRHPTPTWPAGNQVSNDRGTGSSDVATPIVEATTSDAKDGTPSRKVGRPKKTDRLGTIYRRLVEKAELNSSMSNAECAWLIMRVYSDETGQSVGASTAEKAVAECRRNQDGSKFASKL